MIPLSGFPATHSALFIFFFIVSKSSSKSKSKKPAFGGYAINFAGRQETVEQVFGNKPIAPSEMTKKIWAFVKAKSLSNR